MKLHTVLRHYIIVLISIVTALGVQIPRAALSENHDITRQSLRNSGVETTSGDSIDPQLSSDGTVLVFSSDANDLVSDDFDTHSDIFVVNRATPTPQPARISSDTSGDDSDGDNDQPHISADGKVIVFRSNATDLIVGPLTWATPQIFMYNRLGTPTPRPTPIGSPGPFALISVDSSGNPGNAASFSPKSSNNGSYVVFSSQATNLSTSCATSGRSQIFLFDATQSSAPVRCVSVNGDGTAGNANSYAPSISQDGAYIVFESVATNLTAVNTLGKKNIYLLNRASGAITLVSSDAGLGVADGDSSNPHINSAGTHIVFQTSALDIVPGCPSVSGRSSVILYTIADGSKTCASVNSAGVNCNGNSIKPLLSGDASAIVYQSDCVNLVGPEVKLTPASGAFDLYKYVRATPTITRENTTTTQAQVTPGVGGVAVNGTGSIVAFDSAAALAENDRNDKSDIYLTNTACSTDADADGTPDCSDGCYLDAAKSTAGVCGCGVAETDTDGDSTPDCNDLCSSDALKTAPGSCGCGVRETDLDSNSVSDCIEPSATTTPAALALTSSRVKRRIVASFAIDYLNKGYEFKVELLSGGKVVSSKTVTGSRAIFKGLPSGQYQVRYRISTGLGETTKFSRRQRARV